MKIKLYSCFDHWNSYDRIFIYSDPHFTGLTKDDENMRVLFNYATPQEQIENINARVYKNDMLIILGDIGNPEWLKQLKCKNRVLITGNHDRGNEFYKEYFMEIYNGPVFISNKILLSHEPIVGKNWLNIHGHVHDFYTANIEPNNMICCAANIINYQPLWLNKIIETGMLNSIKDIHRETIDEATFQKGKELINWKRMF